MYVITITYTDCSVEFFETGDDQIRIKDDYILIRNLDQSVTIINARECRKITHAHKPEINPLATAFTIS